MNAASTAAGALRGADSAPETTNPKDGKDAASDGTAANVADARSRRSRGAPIAGTEALDAAAAELRVAKPAAAENADRNAAGDSGSGADDPEAAASMHRSPTPRGRQRKPRVLIAVAKQKSKKSAKSNSGSRHLPCEHKARRTQCAQCSGGSVCIHGRQKHLCKEGSCKGKSLCVHNRQRSKCKECTST